MGVHRCRSAVKVGQAAAARCALEQRSPWLAWPPEPAAGDRHLQHAHRRLHARQHRGGACVAQRRRVCRRGDEVASRVGLGYG